MAFKDTARAAINLEEYGNDLPAASELEIDDPTVLDQIDAQEDEVALVEGEGEIEGDLADMDEGEALAETADEEVADAEEVLAEADAKAAETGEEAVIPVEDVVASQEALKTLIKLSGEEYTGTFANREDIYGNSRASYVQNLEGLKQIAAGIKKGLKAIWDKIVAGFKWVVEQIKKVLPTKLNRIKWTLENLRKVPAGAVDGAKIKEAVKAFSEAGKTKYAGIAAIVGGNLDKIGAFVDEIKFSLKQADQAVATFKAQGTGSGEIQDKVSSQLEKKTSFASVIPNPAEIAKSLNEQVSGYANADVSNATALSVTAKGQTVKVLYSVTVKDDEGAASTVFVTASANVNTFPTITLSKDVAIKGLAAVVANASAIQAAAAKLSASISDYSNVVAKREESGFFAKSALARKVDKNLRKYVSQTISAVTSFDSAVLGYTLAYGKATLKAVNGAAKKAE